MSVGSLEAISKRLNMATMFVIQASEIRRWFSLRPYLNIKPFIRVVVSSKYILFRFTVPYLISRRCPRSTSNTTWNAEGSLAPENAGLPFIMNMGTPPKTASLFCEIMFVTL